MRLKFLRAFREDNGSSLVEMALLMPVLMLLFVGTVDFGRAYYAAIEVSSAAEAGALYGVQNPTDTAGMVAASRLDAGDLPSMTPVATYGCQCSGGGSVVAGCGTAPTCPFNVVNYVQVNTTYTYTPIIRYPGLSAVLTLHGSAKMRAAH
jgi:Flp pilus assembly protein TadG